MKKMMMVMSMIILAVFLAVSVQAQDKVATPADARELLQKVVDYAKANGCEKTFTEINEGTAFKIYKNAYPSSVGLSSGITYAHSRLVALVGRDVTGVKDAEGVPFVKNSLEKRKKNFTDSSPTYYQWMDTKTNQVETRSMIANGYSCGGKYGDVSLSVTYEGKI